MEIGEKIQENRKKAKISQEELAEKVGVSRQAVSKWETGQSLPSAENMIALAGILGIPIEELVNPGGQDEMVGAVHQKVDGMRTRKWLPVSTGTGLLLALGALAAAIYGRVSSSYTPQTVLALVILSAACVLLAFLPILISILGFVYRDCRARGIKPGFWVLASTTVAGLLYYLLSRDSMTGR